MVVVLLLVIIAIMLFGSAAVVGAAQRGIILLLAGGVVIAVLIAVMNAWARATELEHQIIIGVPIAAMFVLFVVAFVFSEPPTVVETRPTQVTTPAASRWR